MTMGHPAMPQLKRLRYQSVLVDDELVAAGTGAAGAVAGSTITGGSRIGSHLRNPLIFGRTHICRIS
jgi:hypothetical protein